MPKIDAENRHTQSRRKKNAKSTIIVCELSCRVFRALNVLPHSQSCVSHFVFFVLCLPTSKFVCNTPCWMATIIGRRRCRIRRNWILIQFKYFHSGFSVAAACWIWINYGALNGAACRLTKAYLFTQFVVCARVVMRLGAPQHQTWPSCCAG